MKNFFSSDSSCTVIRLHSHTFHDQIYLQMSKTLFCALRLSPAIAQTQLSKRIHTRSDQFFFQRKKVPVSHCKGRINKQTNPFIHLKLGPSNPFVVHLEKRLIQFISNPNDPKILKLGSQIQAHCKLGFPFQLIMM